MAVAIQSYGYPAVFDEVSGALLEGAIDAEIAARYFPRVGAARFAVIGEGDWEVTAQVGLDRGIRIAAGIGVGDAIMDDLPTYDTFSLPAVSTARWIMVVARRSWSAPATTTFFFIEGTSTKELPARSDNPGFESDQPVALVWVDPSQTVVGTIVNLRCWAANGGLVVADKLALDYLNTPGARVLLGGTEYRYVPNSEGAFAWEARETMFREWNAITSVPVSGPGGTKAVSFPAGMFDVAPIVTLTKASGTGAKLVPYVTSVTASGCTVGLYSGDGDAYSLSLNVNLRAVQTSPGRAAGVNP